MVVLVKNPGPVGLWGVIRDMEGTILLSYSGPACLGSSNKAELLALRTGIREGDLYCVIQWANQSSNPPWNLADIIEEVVQMSWG